MTRAAAAPSDICDELPAVIVPFAWNAGRNFASPSSEVSRRTPSSLANVTSREVFFPFSFNSSNVTLSGTTSSSKCPASCAAAARWCERSAKASCSSRETSYLRATFSVASPMLR